MLVYNIVALTNLYGQVTPKTVADIYNQHHPEQVTTQDIAVYLEEDLSQHYTYSYYKHFANETVVEFKMYKQLKKEKGKLPHYVPDKEELLRYTDVDYYEKPSSYHQLQQHLTGHYFPNDPEKAEMLTERIREECLDGLDRDKVVELMCLYEVLPEGPEAADVITDLAKELYYSTRHWEYNGHTPEEVQELGMPTPLPLAPPTLKGGTYFHGGKS